MKRWIAPTLFALVLSCAWLPLTAQEAPSAGLPGERAAVSVGYSGETEIPQGISLTRDFAKRLGTVARLPRREQVRWSVSNIRRSCRSQPAPRQ